MGRHLTGPGLVRGPLSVSFVCSGFPNVGQPFPFIGVVVPQVGQPFAFIGVLIAARPGLPARLGGPCALIGVLSTLDGLVGGISRIRQAPLVARASLLGLVGDASALLDDIRSCSAFYAGTLGPA